MGAARAWRFGTGNDEDFRETYVREQREAVLAAMAEYSPDVPVVLDADFGHTDPQLVMPHGGEVRIDPAARSVSPLLTRSATPVSSSLASTSTHTDA